MSIKYTKDQKAIIDRIWELLDYWTGDEFDKKRAATGIAFSILCMLDNVSEPFGICPESYTLGGLHELLYKREPGVKKRKNSKQGSPLGKKGKKGRKTVKISANFDDLGLEN